MVSGPLFNAVPVLGSLLRFVIGVGLTRSPKEDVRLHHQGKFAELT